MSRERAPDPDEGGRAEVRLVDGHPFIPLPDHREYSLEEMARRAAEFLAEIRRRRTVRHFSDRPVPRDVIESCLRAAGRARRRWAAHAAG